MLRGGIVDDAAWKYRFASHMGEHFAKSCFQLTSEVDSFHAAALSREPSAHQAIHADALLGRPNGGLAVVAASTKPALLIRTSIRPWSSMRRRTARSLSWQLVLDSA